MIRYARALLILISLVSAGIMLSFALELQTGRTSAPDSRARATVRSYYAAMEAYCKRAIFNPFDMFSPQNSSTVVIRSAGKPPSKTISSQCGRPTLI
jgi:hypothetical protein